MPCRLSDKGATNTIHTHQTAPTHFVEATGIRFAYRRFGQTGGVPARLQPALTLPNAIFHGAHHTCLLGLWQSLQTPDVSTCIRS
jgi:hypothetical protein